mgnify:CR=1 FL=1
MKQLPSEDFSSSFRLAITERCRPSTAMTRTGIVANRNPIVNKRKRPQSSSAKILEKKEIKYQCGGCGQEDTVTLEGLADFF